MLSRKASRYHNCRWCNTPYMAQKEAEEAGFCTTAHKMAHHRAYKRYVTRTTRQMPGCQAKRVTQKRHK